MFYIDSGRSTCCYFVGFRYDRGNTRFSSGDVAMSSFNFNGQIMGIGGSPELKSVEILGKVIIMVSLFFFES